MKRLLYFAAILFMVGCSTAPTQTYRPRNYDGPAWEIKCDRKVGLVDDVYVIRINGKSVVEGKLSDFKDHDEIEGMYEGHRVTSSMTRTGSGVQVMVFVDGERAATF